MILGAVQGLTEFLPVSSSGHLILAHQIFPRFDASLSFDIALHVGTLLALLALMRREVSDLLLMLWSVVRRRSPAQEARLLWMIVLATIPGAAAGFFLEKSAENYFRNPQLVGVTLILGGVLFFVAERFDRQRLSLLTMSYTRALIIGFAQMLALVPGISRSGSTIIAGLFAGLQRREAVRFSFLLSMPIILGAIASSADTLPTVWGDTALRNDFLIGIATSFIVGMIAIRFLLRFTERYSFRVFGWYRIVVGAIALLLPLISRI